MSARRSPQAGRILRRIGAAAALLCLLASTGAGSGAVSEDLRWLPLRRPVTVDSVPPGAWLEVWEDSLLSAASGPDFRDVRIGSADGRVIPFARREPHLAEPHLEPLPQTGGWRRQDDQVMGEWDLGDSPRVGRPVVTIEPDSVAAVASAWTSGDQESWQEAPWERTDLEPGWKRRVGAPPPAPPMRPRAATALDGRRRVPAAGRYLRITVPTRVLPDGAVPSVRVEGLVYHPSPRVPVDFEPVEARYRGREWIERLRLLGPARALSGIEFVLPEHPVRLPVTVSVLPPEGGWHQVASADILADTDTRGSRRRLEWEPVRARELRLVVSGGDPPHDPITIATVEAVPFRFAVPPEERDSGTGGIVPGGVFIYFGDPGIALVPPGLEPLLPGIPEIVRADPGAAEPNPYYRPPGFGLEWLRRRPWAVTAAMAIVLAVLFLIVLRRRRPEGEGI